MQSSSHPHVSSLHYGWVAWPEHGTLFPEQPFPEFPAETKKAWGSDGLTVIEHQWAREHVQIVFAATAQLSPVEIARLAKGRLQHALRQVNWPAKFSRKVAIRAIGRNTRETVESYVKHQLDRADLADPRYRDSLAKHAIADPRVRLDEPAETERGRYWYNLHVVLVTSDRYRMGGAPVLETIREACRSAAATGGYGLAKLAVMPDHLHLAVRGNPQHAPVQVIEAFRDAMAKQLRMTCFWKEGGYVGTFGEYGLDALHGNRRE
jgi:REP element-mobilizing transposase RayT